MTGAESPFGDEPSRERGGIQSLERAFGLLEEIARNPEGISLAELSKRVGLHNSTTFHLVKTMASLGYIEQVRDSKRYRVGRHLFTLAAGALNEIELVGFTTPVLEKLTRETGECSHFAVRSGGNIVVLARTVGAGMFQMADQVGVMRPSHCTALGKVLLASLSSEQLDHYLRSQELRAYTPKTITDRAKLLREIKTVRRDGIGYDDGEFDAEARCVAVPVRDFTGRVAGAIGISGPVWRLSIAVLQEKAHQVRDAAVVLSRELGFQAAAPDKTSAKTKAVRAKA
ncbi:MAG: IclR family transcriptional regulator [Stellaceae bacterium]